MDGLTGRIVTPDKESWEQDRRGFAEHAEYAEHVPSVVVFAQTVEDVQNAVRWAIKQNKPVRIRCGRHGSNVMTLSNSQSTIS